jgi:hypothetical protein
MLTLKINEESVSFKFKDLYSGKLLYTEVYSHTSARQIAEDILVFLDHCDECKADLHD